MPWLPLAGRWIPPRRARPRSCAFAGFARLPVLSIRSRYYLKIPDQAALRMRLKAAKICFGSAGFGITPCSAKV